ncbi:hypothetical protein [Phosphitispora sp. TUW77]|uniref:hypothetical protein n=1 Tax=Phosphitispora sp. TUW77 TaxID=3152361 RepID=UPI003AB69074
MHLDYSQLFCDEVIKSGKSAYLTASGTSMWPAIVSGMKAEIAPLGEELPPKGTMILVKGCNGLMVHRYWGIRYEKNIPLIITKGDTNFCFDPSVTRDLVLGRVVMLLNNKNDARNPNRGFWRLYGRMVCSSEVAARLWARLCRMVLKAIMRVEMHRSV